MRGGRAAGKRWRRVGGDGEEEDGDDEEVEKEEEEEGGAQPARRTRLLPLPARRCMRAATPRSARCRSGAGRSRCRAGRSHVESRHGAPEP